MGLVSSLKDKNGVSHDIAAKRMSGTRNFSIEGDVVGQSGDVTLENGVSINVSIQDNAVDTSCIQDGAVTNGKIYTGAVSEDKLSSEVQAELGKAHTHDNKSKLDKYKNAGTSSVPVYIAADGTPTACTDDFARDSELSAEASARQSGDSSTLQSAKEYTDEAVASVTLDPTGDSTHAVFINAEGKPQQVDKVASASSADVAVKATNDASGNPIETSYSKKTYVDSKNWIYPLRIGSETDLNSLAKTDGKVCWYNWVSSNKPINVPTGIGSGYMKDVPSLYNSGQYHTQFCYTASNSEFYYCRSNYEGSNKWTSWEKVYYGALNKYDSTSVQSISGMGVSAAIDDLCRSNVGNFVKFSVESNTADKWCKMFSISSSETTTNLNVSCRVSLISTSSVTIGYYTCVMRVSSKSQTIPCNFVTYNRSSDICDRIKIYAVVEKVDDPFSSVLSIYVKIPSGTNYCSVSMDQVKGFNYNGAQRTVSINKSSSPVTSEPTGNVSSYATLVENSYIKSFSDKGGAGVPVFVNTNGEVIACTTSELMAGKDGSGNVITSTYATKSEVNTKSFIKGLELKTGDDLNNVRGIDTGESWYFWQYSTQPTHHLDVDSGAVLKVVRNANTNYTKQFVYTPNNYDYYFFRQCRNGEWESSWTKVYYKASSSYNSTSEQPISGKGVASALAGYLATSRLKGSGDVASMESDDSNAYTGKAISQKITDAIGGNIGGWLGNKSVAEINAMSYGSLKSGDYATITDNGTITLGNVSVTAGDEIYFVPSETIWQKKDNSTYVKKTDIASDKVGVVKASDDDGKVAVSSSGVMSVNGWDTLKGRVSTAESNVTTLQGTTAQHTTDIATINSTIVAMDMDQKGGDGKYIKSITQVDGKVTVEVASLDTSLSDSSGGDYAPTSAAVKDYVDAKSSEATSTANAYADEKFGSLSATYNSADESLTFDNITFK